MSLSRFKNQLENEFSELIKTLTIKYDYLEIFIDSENIYAALLRLRNEYGFDMLSDLTCVDFVEEKDRFEMIYNLYSLNTHMRIIIKTEIPEAKSEIVSVVKIYKSANWYEREVFDMFGIVFTGHPNMRRILMYEGFEGYPLRKDYKATKRQPQVGPVEYIKPCGIDGGESLEKLKNRLVVKRD